MASKVVETKPENIIDAEEPKKSPAVEELEESLLDLVKLTRVWAGYGLSVGSQALDASAKSLQATSRFLNSLSNQVGESAKNINPTSGDQA